MSEPISSASQHRPLLTIAVPTYNRSANLALLLKFLTPQIAVFPEVVELLVSDNASSDDTSQVVRSYMDAGAVIRYRCHAENIGPDANFLSCLNDASGKYVWIFGDDDVIFPGSLSYLLRHLAQQEVDLVFLSPFGFVHDPNERLHADSAPHCWSFEDARKFVHAVGLRGDLILLSAVIVNKETIDRSSHPDFTFGTQSNLLQLSWVFTALRNFHCGLVFDRGLYAVCELNPQRPFDAIRVFGVNWAQMADRYLEIESRLHTTILRNQLYSWFPTNWYGLRRTPGRTVINDPVGQMKPIYKRFVLFWLCVYPLLAWPIFPAGIWLAVWRMIRGIDRWLHLQLYPPFRLPAEK